MNIDYDEIRAKQQAATPGPWHFVDGMVYASEAVFTKYCGWTYKTGALVRGTAGMHGEFYKPADAEYIAAVSPDVVGALLDRIEMLEEALESAQRFLTIPGSGFKDYLLAEIETALAGDSTHDCSCACHGKHEGSGHSLCSHCDAGYAAYEAAHEQVIGGRE